MSRCGHDRESDSGQSTPRSISTSAASSPLRFASFDGQGAANRMRLSDDGQWRTKSRSSDTGSGMWSSLLYRDLLM